MVIVWERGASGVSSDPDDRLLEPHVTPLDWALAWSLRRAESAQNIPAIAIIDARIDDWGGGWSWQVRRQLLADMPWVVLAATVIRPDGASYLHRPVLVLPDASPGGLLVRSVDQWSLAMDWTARRIADREYRALRMLWRLWAASLKESDEHHDINNIVGARMLLAAAPDGLAQDASERSGSSDKAASPTALAFLQKVAWCQKATSERTGWEIWPNESKKEYPFNKKVFVTLYDDMHATGWGSFLFAFLSKLNPSISEESTPGKLLSFLSERAVFDKRDFIQNVSVKKNGHPEIIFLDFRLYPRAKRAAFLNDTKTLLKLAERFTEFKTLAWDAIKQSEIDGLKDWLSRGAPEAEHWDDQSLLLLPRLLALALPLTPIILFSSTSQARIREQLKPYRNIFTGFQKPNPLGNPASIEIAITALGSAMDRAMPMLQRRLQLAYVQTEAKRLEASRPKDRVQKHFEIFFDESGSEKLCSTAAIASFNSIEEADAAADKMNALFVERQLTIRKSNALSQASLEGDLRILSEALGQDLQIDIVSLKCESEEPLDIAELSLKTFRDSRLDEAIYHNVCFVVFVYTNFLSEDASISIHLATRTMYEPTLNRLRGAYFQRFGLSSYVNNGAEDGTVESYDKASAFPLVRGWLRSWGRGRSLRSKNILSIIAKTIRDGEYRAQRMNEFGRPLHFIADWAAGFIGIAGDTKHKKTLGVLRPVLGEKMVSKVFLSDLGASNVSRLCEALRLSICSENPQIDEVIVELCNSHLVSSAGNQGLNLNFINFGPDASFRSMPQEHFWLWAIFPYVEGKASGDNLMAGL
ncbi:hypothetical protein [Hyphomonas sp.]|uniref:hypothetical protein n=1 Tax=Hyphomonas sp. TaxID=87 RepID=UPI0025BD2048|nr:hypothetical protein [Hyphomonas sp.]